MNDNEHSFSVAQSDDPENGWISLGGPVAGENLFFSLAVNGPDNMPAVAYNEINDEDSFTKVIKWDGQSQWIEIGSFSLVHDPENENENKKEYAPSIIQDTDGTLLLGCYFFNVWLQAI